MQTLEPHSAVIPFPATDTEVSKQVATASEGKAGGNYESVRFNAMKHGILSKLTVLAHENHAEFDDLLAALIEEHRPAGMTELHLVEELAAIIWRKRRVLLAEGAAINRGLLSVATARHDRNTDLPGPAQAAAPFELGRERPRLSHPVELAEAMTLPPEQVAKCHREAHYDLEATRKAAAILRRGGATAYDKALRALTAWSRDWWDEHIEEEQCPASAEGLAGFIRDHLEPLCRSTEKEARHHEAIKAQALGEGLQAHRLEKLNRYETHLDRKFERTLAMLLKLRELRGG